MEELIIEAKNKNASAFSKLLSYFENDMYRIAKMYLNNLEDINDAIQETAIQAYLSINRLKDNSKFKVWLIKILINKCNDIYRKEKKYHNIFNKLSFSEETHTTLETNVDFFYILQNLKYKEKLILTLYYLDNYTSKEIAQILNMNINTVKTKINRTKTKLSKILKEDNYNE